MGYDAMANDASSCAVAARDGAKKKRGNRSAKLKQCKLDARREQWLAQVKDGKDAKAVTGAATAGANAGSPILASPHPPLPRRRAEARPRGGEHEEDEREEAGGDRQEISSSDLDSPTHSPGSNNSGSSVSRKHCPGNGVNHSISSGSSAWSSSRSVSDAEDEDTGGGQEEEENGVLDDWEAVADALSADNNHGHQSSGPTAPPAAPTACVAPAHPVTTPEPIRSRTRAWRPDDAFRPQSLPNISKQASFPASMGNHWVGMGIGASQKGILSLQSSCPICYEDLDPTDSSFLPCPCGFHLCLFCHKRILEADGRCPGCRKQYNSVPTGGGEADKGREMASVVAMRLSRSCSMGPRY